MPLLGSSLSLFGQEGMRVWKCDCWDMKVYNVQKLLWKEKRGTFSNWKLWWWLNFLVSIIFLYNLHILTVEKLENAYILGENILEIITPTMVVLPHFAMYTCIFLNKNCISWYIVFSMLSNMKEQLSLKINVPPNHYFNSDMLFFYKGKPQ